MTLHCPACETIQHGNKFCPACGRQLIFPTDLSGEQLNRLEKRLAKLEERLEKIEKTLDIDSFQEAKKPSEPVGIIYLGLGPCDEEHDGCYRLEDISFDIEYSQVLRLIDPYGYQLASWKHWKGEDPFEFLKPIERLLIQLGIEIGKGLIRIEGMEIFYGGYRLQPRMEVVFDRDPSNARKNN